MGALIMQARWLELLRALSALAALVTPDGALELREMWLGTPQESEIVGRCGHRFRRLGG